MLASERIVNIASKFYEARRAMRGLCGDAYAAQVEPFMRVISRNGKDAAMSAALDLAKKLDANGLGTSIVWVLAAVPEVLEPDELTPVIS